MEYELEIKQLVTYSRCRIYRKFIRELMKDSSIRYSGRPGLFAYMVLCSYANFRTSYRRIEGISYTVYPGEWVCTVAEISEWLRLRYHHQAIKILNALQEQHLITYSKIGHGKVRFRITNWEKSNTVVDFNAPCCKDLGFFFFPVDVIPCLLSLGKCCEADMILDLWLNAIYQDERVTGSELGPVVYLRDGSGSPVLSYDILATRWSVSKATVCRVMKHLAEKDHIEVIPFAGRGGSVIYLQNYLSTMFNIADVMIDKEEVALTLRIPVSAPNEHVPQTAFAISGTQIAVSSTTSSVSKSYIHYLIEKVAQILMAQGVSCCQCPKSIYKLYPLSDGGGIYELLIICGESGKQFRFELALAQSNKWRNKK